MQKEYRIKRQSKEGEDYETMIISNRETGEEIAEYRIDGAEGDEIRRMRRIIDKHLEEGGTLGNYQW
jgi:hypothetical protein